MNITTDRATRPTASLGRAVPEAGYVSSYCRHTRASWGVDDYEAAPAHVRDDLRNRYADALDAFRALPPVCEYERRSTRSRASSGRPAFLDPAGQPLRRELAEHLEAEIESDRRIRAMLAEAERAGRLAREAALVRMNPPDLFDHLSAPKLPVPSANAVR